MSVADKLLDEAKRQEADDLKAVMSTPHGRRLVARWLDQTGLYRLSFDGSSRTYFMEGQRAIGLGILDEIMQACPELRLVMEQEAYEQQKIHKLLLEEAKSKELNND